MRLLLVVFCWMFGLSTQERIGWRIVGGYNAFIEEYPFHASLRIRGQHKCSGSIISSRSILTAAHCIYNKSPKEVTVVTGSSYLDRGGVLYQVRKIKIHEYFNISTIHNDIALLILNRSIVFNSETIPIRLNPFYIGPDVNCELCGFGISDFPNGNITNELQVVGLATISYELCKQLLDPSPIYPSQLCTLSKKGLGTCKGDSGSPLISYGIQIGIVSWGRSCALGYPDVFTRISSYIDWIVFNVA
ncbi:hypothetical protein FQA39_LY15710 [Lamprigera yunnana]|nr:hypothetical protein FQA39_LY15710 [Lamprigera yunnana]